MENRYTLKIMLEKMQKCHPEKTAFIMGERHVTIRELGERTRSMGSALRRLGLENGARVAILSRNSIESCESYLSIPNAGLVLVMLNFRLAPQELIEILKDSQVSVVMVAEEFTETIQQIRGELVTPIQFISMGSKDLTPPNWLHYQALIDNNAQPLPDLEVSETSLAALMYTSGTTGKPKGCMVTHRDLYHVGRRMTTELPMGENDTCIIPAPLFHASGFVPLFSSFFSMNTVIIMEQWNTEHFMELIERHKVTTTLLTAPMLLYFVENSNVKQYNLSSLKNVLFAGAPVARSVFRKAIEQFGNIFIHTYGSTETVGSACFLKRKDVALELAAGRDEILESCGRPYLETQIEIVDERDYLVAPGVIGEIRFRGLGQTGGYWKNEKETQKVLRGEGWYYTGDLAKYDKQGFIYIVGMKKDMIITDGENVYPAEVENVLHKHSAVYQAAVVGFPDERWTESVTAFVVKRNGVSVSEDDLQCFCTKQIASYKIPKKIFFVSALPLSASGKLVKRKLINLLP